MSKGVGGLRAAAGGVVVCLLAAAPAATAAGGNDFYGVTVEALPGGVGIGVYTATTGTMHPITGALGAQNVLFGGGVPGTSYTSLRSYTSGTDYVQRNSVALAGGAPLTLPLEGFVLAGEEAIPVGDPMSPLGFRTIYRVGSAAAAPDLLRVEQETSVVGATFNTSAVQVRTSITNEGSAPVSVGVRYLWDFQIGPGDDGPSFLEKDPDGVVIGSEAAYAAPAFERFESVDNNDPGACFGLGNSPFPFFAVSGTVLGPAALAPTPPTKLAYVSWPHLSGLAGKVLGVIPATNAFDYAPAGMDAASCIVSVDDTGVAYWWGDQAGNALSIAPGATVSVAAYIFAYLPGSPPTFGGGMGQEGPHGDPTCSDGQDNDGDGLVDLDDPDCQAPTNQPPDCSAAEADPGRLWPPNHKLRRVSVSGVTDPDGDPVQVTVTGIFQDEPVDGRGDGNTCPDGGGVGSDMAYVRSERTGRGDGRVYHLDFTAGDGRGGACAGSVAVCVPHDQSRRKSQCVDQGPLFDSTAACPRPGKRP
jgi:hypothetical protein